MRTVAKLLMVGCLVLLSHIPSAAKSWRGLTPLQSTRPDVIQKWGDGLDPKRPGSRYILENEDVWIRYSDKDDFNECLRQLPPGLVLEIAVVPRSRVSINSLVVDPKMVRTLLPSPDMPLTTAFIADEEGLVVSENIVSSNKVAQEIKYLPAKKDRARCPSHYDDLSKFINKVLCVLCPQISVVGSEAVEAGDPAQFVVLATVGASPPELTFHWTVSNGTITSGQGTALISVDSKSLEGKTINATVEVEGIDPACGKTASLSTRVIKRRTNSR